MKKGVIVILALILLVAGFAVFGKEVMGGFTRIKNQASQFLASRFDGVDGIVQKIEVQEEVIEKFDLERLSQAGGLQDLNKTDKYVEEQSSVEAGVRLQEGQVSYYQAFVTPNDVAVLAVAGGKQAEAVYQEAVSWVWVPDRILHNQEEKWLTPNFFLTRTAGLTTNPVKGRIASDCESQAYTLVSALRAAGVSAEEARVVTGMVNFGGSVGGHAWAELYDKASQSWFQLEATSGNYYDPSTNKYVESSGLPFGYFKTYQYPAAQIWTYFNDKYFWDNNRNQGTAPESWLSKEAQSKKAPDKEIKYELPEELKRVRQEEIKVIIEPVKSDEGVSWQEWVQKRREDQPIQITQPSLQPSIEMELNVASPSSTSIIVNDELLKIFRWRLRR